MIIGLQDLTDRLRRLPLEVQREVTGLAREAAARMVSEVRTRVPVVTGTLRRSVQRKDVDRGALVVVRAPHASLYEYGTTVRHTSTGASRGRMPPANWIIRVAQDERAQFLRAVQQMLDRLRLE